MPFLPFFWGRVSLESQPPKKEPAPKKKPDQKKKKKSYTFWLSALFMATGYLRVCSSEDDPGFRTARAPSQLCGEAGGLNSERSPNEAVLQKKRMENRLGPIPKNRYPHDWGICFLVGHCLDIKICWAFMSHRSVSVSHGMLIGPFWSGNRFSQSVHCKPDRVVLWLWSTQSWGCAFAC